jgi:hypothetical protein
LIENPQEEKSRLRIFCLPIYPQMRHSGKPAVRRVQAGIDALGDICTIGSWKGVFSFGHPLNVCAMLNVAEILHTFSRNDSGTCCTIACTIGDFHEVTENVSHSVRFEGRGSICPDEDFFLSDISRVSARSLLSCECCAFCIHFPIFFLCFHK